MQKAPRLKFPHKVKVGSSTVTIYRVKNRGKSNYSATWYEGHTRKLKNFSDVSKALEEAKDTATKLNSGRAQAIELTGADRDSWVICRRKLIPLGIPVHTAIEEYVAAAKILEGLGSLSQAAKFYAERHRKDMPARKVAEVVEEFIAVKTADGMSLRYLSDIRSRLGKFGEAFQVNILNARAEDIQKWIHSVQGGPRTRNNYLGLVTTLFRFARSRGYLPKGLPTEPEELGKAKDPGGDIGILTPDQLATVLAAETKTLKKHKAKLEQFIPYLCLGGFAGLRHAEITRLEWSDIDFTQKIIRVSAKKSKTAQNRHVPMSDNLISWLSTWRNRKGQVCSDRQSKKPRAVAKDLKVTWPPNCLRHSYGSYRLASIKDAPRLALEMGNSPSMIFRHYRQLVTEIDAGRWFGIVPDVEIKGKIIAIK